MYNGQRLTQSRDRGNRYSIYSMWQLGLPHFYFGGNMPRKESRTGQDVECRVCGKKIYKTITRLKRSNGIHYCSRACQDRGRHIDAYEMRNCEICGSQFECPKRSKQRFCSDACQNEWQRTRVGILNPKYNRVERTCEYCGSTIYEQPYKVSIGCHLFCNKHCRQAWYSEVFSQSEEWKNECRKRAVNLLEEGRMQKTNSVPQQIVDDMLATMNVDFIREYNIKYYSIDNFLTNSGLFIEVMGDFWHCNPIKYDDVKYHQQKKSIGRDKAKHTYIINHFDTEVLYLWECDIISDIEKCKKLTQLYIDNSGDLKNYHSFNYHVVNGELQINDDLIIPYQERNTNKCA